MIRSFFLIILFTLGLALPGCSSPEDRAEEYFQSAQELAEKGDIDRALVELRNVFDLNGSHLEARHLMARLLLEEKNDRRRAYGQYLRLAEQYPSDLKARIALARLAISGGNWEEAERHGSKAQELAPDAAEVQPIATALQYRAAVLAEDETKREGAAAKALSLLEEQPDNESLRAILIDHHVRNLSYRKALENLDWVLERQPDNLGYWRQRLRLLAQMEDAEGIESQLRDMIARFPDNLENQSMLLRFYISRDEIDKAEGFLRELADADAKLQPKIDLIRFLSQFRDAETARAEIDRRIGESDSPALFEVMAAGMDFDQGDREAAIQKMEQVIANLPPDGEDNLNGYRIVLARMLNKTGNLIGARQRVEEVLEDDPNDVAALKMQARWQIEQDDTDAAISALRTALTADGDDAEAMTLMAQAYNRNGQPGLARDFLSLAVEASGNAVPESLRYAAALIAEERFLPAEDILISALRMAPNDPQLLGELGRLYLRMEDYPRVESAINTLRGLDDPAARDVANALETERLSRTQGQGQALAFLENLAADSTDELRPQINLIRARLATGNIDGAVELARTVSADIPDDEGLQFVRAMTEAVAGNHDIADTILAGLVQKDPKRPQVWQQRANMKRLQGDPDAARDMLRQGLDANPSDAGLLWSEASFLERDGDIEGAIEIYEQLYEANSSAILVANNLASLLASYRDDEESLERAWRIGRRLSETKVPAMQDTYGWILHRRGKSGEALPYLEAAAVGMPRDPLTKFHLAEAYMALGRAQDARSNYLEAVELAGPADQRDQIKRARKMLQEIDAE